MFLHKMKRLSLVFPGYPTFQHSQQARKPSAAAEVLAWLCRAVWDFSEYLYSDKKWVFIRCFSNLTEKLSKNCLSLLGQMAIDVHWTMAESQKGEIGKSTDVAKRILKIHRFCLQFPSHFDLRFPSLSPQSCLSRSFNVPTTSGSSC